MRVAVSVAIAIICGSCGSGMKLSKSRLIGIESSIAASYNVHSTSPQQINLPALFHEDFGGTDIVKLNFDKQGDFVITYANILGGKEFRAYQGRFNKGYYEIYLRNDKFIIPIFYSKVNVERLRISIAKDGSLVIYKYWKNSGNIFPLAAGGSSRFQYYFQRI